MDMSMIIKWWIMEERSVIWIILLITWLVWPFKLHTIPLFKRFLFCNSRYSDHRCVFFLLPITAEVHHNAIKIATQTNFLCGVISTLITLTERLETLTLSLPPFFYVNPKSSEKYLSVKWLKTRWQTDRYLIVAGNTKWGEYSNYQQFPKWSEDRFKI